MLDKDTLNRLTDLTASTLYNAEVARLSKLSRTEEQALAARARQGDSEARHALIENCLPYALGVARFFYNDRRPSHDDLLDLAQVASENIVAHLDRALTIANEPGAYLRAVGRQAILSYCIYQAGLIQKPHHSNAKLKRLDPNPAIVESLDAPLCHDDGKRIRMEYIQAPAPQPEHDEQGQQGRNAMLYKAIDALPQRQREAIVRVYGLFGHPAETYSDVSGALYTGGRKALKKLRALLADSLDEPERTVERHDDNEPEPSALLHKERKIGQQPDPNRDETPAPRSEDQNIENAGNDLPSVSLAEQPDPLHGPASDLIELRWLQQSGINEPTTELPVDHQLLNRLNHSPDREQWER